MIPTTWHKPIAIISTALIIASGIYIWCPWNKPTMPSNIVEVLKPIDNAIKESEIKQEPLKAKIAANKDQVAVSITKLDELQVIDTLPLKETLISYEELVKELEEEVSLLKAKALVLQDGLIASEMKVERYGRIIKVLLMVVGGLITAVIVLAVVL